MDNSKQPLIVAASPLVYYIDVIPKKLIDIMVEEVMEELEKMEQSNSLFKEASIGTLIDNKMFYTIINHLLLDSFS